MNNLFKIKNGKFVMSEGYGSVKESTNTSNNIKLLAELAKKIGADKDPQLLDDLMNAFREIHSWGQNPTIGVHFDTEEFELDRIELLPILNPAPKQSSQAEKDAEKELGDKNLERAKNANIIKSTVTEPEKPYKSPIKTGDAPTQFKTGIRQPSFMNPQQDLTSSDEDEQEDDVGVDLKAYGSSGHVAETRKNNRKIIRHPSLVPWRSR